MDISTASHDTAGLFFYVIGFRRQASSHTALMLAAGFIELY